MEPKLGNPLVWHVVSLIICVSMVIHGISGAPLTQLFGRTAGKRSGPITNSPETEPSPQ